MRALLALAFVAACPVAAWAKAEIIIINSNGPNEGFNDPTPVAPVGGNPGKTLGEQRLNAFKYAAKLWGEVLDSPVPIRIQASFRPLTCMADGAVLGSASPAGFQQNFANAPLSNVGYPRALADRIAGRDLNPGSADLVANFNSRLGTKDCLPDNGWYLGFDRNFGIKNDLVTVLLHEFGHGLGFVTRATFGGMDVYGAHLLDAKSGKRWPQLSSSERNASSTSVTGLLWDGPNVKAAVPKVLGYPPRFAVTAPANIARTYQIAEANFGPRLTAVTVQGEVALAKDAAGETTACNPPLMSLAGKVALIDRGGMNCLLTDKAKRAQQAGAIAVIIANNVADPIPPAFGLPDPAVTIPAVLVSQADGMTLKQALAGGTVTVEFTADTRARAGADGQDRVRLFAPNPAQQGSSVSHFDVTATPNLLMEPFISLDLRHAFDLTLPLFRDIGWAPDADLDGILDDRDNCAYIPNADQADEDRDGVGDACEGPDLDMDGVPDAVDNCKMVPNPKQTDTDGDGTGDACEDADSDGVPDGLDNCPYTPNADQKDGNGDEIGDACTDVDFDGVPDPVDNCPYSHNPDQADADNDGDGDACDDDTVPGTADLGAEPQADMASDCAGDFVDTDGDGVADTCDPQQPGVGSGGGDDNMPPLAETAGCAFAGAGPGAGPLLFLLPLLALLSRRRRAG